MNFSLEPLDYLESNIDVDHDEKIFLKEELDSRSDENFLMDDFEDRLSSGDEKPRKRSKKEKKSKEHKLKKSKKSSRSKDVEVFSCDYCKGFEIAGKNQFNRHIREHKLRKDKGPHNCPICKGNYFTMDQLFKHVCSGNSSFH